MFFGIVWSEIQLKYVPKKSNSEPSNDLRTHSRPPPLKPEEEQIFREALLSLKKTGIQFLVGGAFAKYFYAGTWRFTKDLDIFLKPVSLKQALDRLTAVGFETHVHDPHWLAKAAKADSEIDLIFGSGNGQIQVDDLFFEGGQTAEIFGVSVQLMPIEEILAMAAYVATRQRFDGSDIAHLIRATRGELDWQRILDRLGEDWELLLWHFILFDFVYPGHSSYLPNQLKAELLDKLQRQWAYPQEQNMAFRGSLLDRLSYAVDINDWGYEDRRNEKPLVDQQGNLL